MRWGIYLPPGNVLQSGLSDGYKKGNVIENGRLRTRRILIQFPHRAIATSRSSMKEVIHTFPYLLLTIAGDVTRTGQRWQNAS